MLIDKTKISIKTKTILEKFEKGTLKEDIDSGKIKPCEVIITEQDMEIDEDQAVALGLVIKKEA